MEELRQVRNLSNLRESCHGAANMAGPVPWITLYSVIFLRIMGISYYLFQRGNVRKEKLKQ